MQGDLNQQIRRLATMLPSSAETKFGFGCECGCGTVVALTPTHFDDHGAWADGHKPASPPKPAIHQLLRSGGVR
jgi:hypothetical protein